MIAFSLPPTPIPGIQIRKSSWLWSFRVIVWSWGFIWETYTSARLLLPARFLLFLRDDVWLGVLLSPSKEKNKNCYLAPPPVYPSSFSFSLFAQQVSSTPLSFSA